jgi:hypothetical protein
MPGTSAPMPGGSDPARARRAQLLTARLDFIRLAAQHIADAERMLRSAVDDARHAGATWQQIGDVLGTTRQAAHERFTREP